MNKKLYQFILFGLEKLDKRETVIKRIGYKMFKYLYPIMFKRAYKMSPYDPRAQCGHDLYMENLEYEMRSSIDGGDEYA
tara:strand:- start:251 stop:487 length:237 start_codon:yes stop_codon:yes gene_type:complete